MANLTEDFATAKEERENRVVEPEPTPIVQSTDSLTEQLGGFGGGGGNSLLGSGGLVADITDSVGLTDHAGAQRAARDAREARKKANQAATNQLEFTKNQYADWQAVYGDIQTNLGNYFKELGGEKVTSLGLQAQEIEQQRLIRDTKELFAQRGLSDSGLEASTLSDIQRSGASQRAGIRATSEERAVEAKTSFLSLGLGLGAQRESAVSGAFGQQARLFSQQALASEQIAADKEASNIAFRRELVGLGVGVATGGLGGVPKTKSDLIVTGTA